MFKIQELLLVHLLLLTSFLHSGDRALQCSHLYGCQPWPHPIIFGKKSYEKHFELLVWPINGGGLVSDLYWSQPPESDINDKCLMDCAWEGGTAASRSQCSLTKVSEVQCFSLTTRRFNLQEPLDKNCVKILCLMLIVCLHMNCPVSVFYFFSLVPVSRPRIWVLGRAVLGRPVQIACQSDIGSLPINYTLLKHYDTVNSVNVNMPQRQAVFTVTATSTNELNRYMCGANNRPGSQDFPLSPRLNATVIGECVWIHFHDW